VKQQNKHTIQYIDVFLISISQFNHTFSGRNLFHIF